MKLEQIHARPVNNGFVVEVNLTDPDKIQDGPAHYFKTETYVAESHRDVLDIIDNLLRPNGPADAET